MTQPDRIVVINDASTARGGATGLALRSAELLRARGHAVTFICGDDGAGLAPEETVALGHARLLDRDRRAALRQGAWNGAARAMLAGWIAAHDTPRTLYHLHGWAQILTPAIFAALAPVARRTILHAHDFSLACPNGVYMNFPAGRPCGLTPLSSACLTTHCDKRSRLQKGWRVLRHAALRRAFGGAPWAAVAMIHPAMAEPLARGGVPRGMLRVVRNPAPGWAGKRVPAEDNDRIVFVGRLAAEKGPVALARATAARGVPVTFVGTGPEEAAVRAANPAAEITGWQDRAGIVRHLAGARALAMPSRLPEPFGLAAAEAARAGVPVILPDIALMAEEFVGAQIGWVYAASDAGALEAAVGAAAGARPGTVARMSRRAQTEAARIATTPEQWTEELLALYRAALAGA